MGEGETAGLMRGVSVKSAAGEAGAGSVCGVVISSGGPGGWKARVTAWQASVLLRTRIRRIERRRFFKEKPFLEEQ
jgi:hypothetical protein